MQRYIHRSLMALNRGRTPMTIMMIIAMVTRLAIHPGEAKAEWMTVTLAFTRRSAFSQRHLDLRQHKGTPMPRKHPKQWTGIDIKGLIMSKFPYVRFSLHQNASHIKVQIWSGSVLLIKVVSRKSERFKETFSVFTTLQANTSPSNREEAWKAIKLWNRSVKLS